MFITTSKTGIPLREIIKNLGNKSYPYIEFRCKWTEEDGLEYDEYFGACSYDNQTGILTPLDHDSYSLDDLYNEWDEWQDLKEEHFDKDQFLLTVWEYYGKIQE